MQFDWFSSRHVREALISWHEAGRVTATPTTSIESAWQELGVEPLARQWQSLIGSALLIGGALSLAAGIVFFFAYNWEELSPLARFATLAVAVVLAAVAALALRARPMAARSALFVAMVISGVLLATIGQTYQTGADPYQLFGAWAVLATLWALAARAPVFWWVVMLLILLTVARFVEVHVGFGMEALFINAFSASFFNAPGVLLAVSLVLLMAWTLLARQAPKLGFGGKVGPRLMILAACGFAVWLGVTGLFDSSKDSQSSFLRLGLAFATFAVLLLIYRRSPPDLFALSTICLGGSVLIMFCIGRLMAALANYLEMVIVAMGLTLVVLSGASAKWLRSMAKAARNPEQPANRS